MKNPCKNYLFYVFDNLYLGGGEDYFFFSKLIKNFQMLIGLDLIPNPEYESKPINFKENIEELLIKLDKILGIKIDFPNIFNHEKGLPTTRGIMSTRSLQSLYFICKMKLILGDNFKNSSILEFGAGMGKNAYYAYKMGIKKYTIIDIPETNIVQSYYLGNICGNENINLFKENNASVINILPCNEFDNLNEVFDLIVQFDGLTEMGKTIAQNYVDKFPNLSEIFFSINHEANEYTVQDLYKNNENILLKERSLSWYREGYVEELLIKR